MNTGNIFFWNDSKVWKYDLKNFGKTMEKLSINVSAQEPQTRIRKVRTGSTEDKIVILIRQSKLSDCSITWNVPIDHEIESFDHDLNPDVFWDAKGDAYITEEDRVYVTQMGLSLKCFKFNKQEDQ